MKKKLFFNYYLKNLVILLFFLYFLLFLPCNSFAAYPKLVSKLVSAFDKIQSWLLLLSTPAAAIAIGSGVFMKKFSFGDEERMQTGKRLIRNSLFSYAFIICTDLILSTIAILLQ